MNVWFQIQGTFQISSRLDEYIRFETKIFFIL